MSFVLDVQRVSTATKIENARSRKVQVAKLLRSSVKEIEILRIERGKCLHIAQISIEKNATEAASH